MKALTLLVLLATLAACQSTAPQPVNEPTPPAAAMGDPKRGLDIADRNCSLCHAVGPQGASPNSKAPAFRTLRGRYPLENLSEALAEGMVVGHSGMPQIQLQPQQINDLIAYLKTLPPEGGR